MISLRHMNWSLNCIELPSQSNYTICYHSVLAPPLPELRSHLILTNCSQPTTIIIIIEHSSENEEISTASHFNKRRFFRVWLLVCSVTWPSGDQSYALPAHWGLFPKKQQLLFGNTTLYFKFLAGVDKEIYWTAHCGRAFASVNVCYVSDCRLRVNVN